MASEYEELRTNITRWLTDEGAQVETRAVPTTHFALFCRLNGAQMMVSALQVPNGVIAVNNVLTLSDTIIQNLDQIPNDRRDAMLWELRLSLVNLVDQIRITDNYHDDPWIILQDTLYAEGLTRAKLMKRVKRLRSALYTAIWIVEKHAGFRRSQQQANSVYQ